jgi:hypothetical protein
MRTGTAKVGAVLALVAASTAVGQATAAAQTEGGHVVRYTLIASAPADFQLNYLVAQPPSKEAYNADAYAYLKKEEVILQPGVPWVFETTMEDPQWAILTASTGVHAMQAPPLPHCEIAIDGEIAVQHDGPYTVQCQLSRW